jgi:ATP/maltotriose-dependent transcriptional regulator MalT
MNQIGTEYSSSCVSVPVVPVLQISHKTVRTHICHIYDKLAIYDRAEVVRYALRKGLVDL